MLKALIYQPKFYQNEDNEDNEDKASTILGIYSTLLLMDKILHHQGLMVYPIVY